MSRHQIDKVGQLLFKLNHYLRYGYIYYYCRQIVNTDDYERVDTKLVLLYNVSYDRNLRAARKKKGIRNIIYLRYKDRFILLASHGTNPNFDRLKYLDFRTKPFLFNTYSIKVKQDIASIQIEKRRFDKLKTKAQTIAHHSDEKVAQFLREISPFTFNGVQQQRWKLYLLINKKRKSGGLKTIEWEKVKRV